MERVENINKEIYNEPYTRTRAKIKPAGTIDVYRIGIPEIQDFITRKVNVYAPGTKVAIYPRFCENKKARPRSGYAALILAFSSEIIEDRSNGDVLRRMIEAEGNVRVIRPVYDNLVRRYICNRKELIEITKDYEKMDAVQEAFGMKDDFLRDLIHWSKPRKHQSGINKDEWVMFAAEPMNIIYDMLTELTVWEPKFLNEMAMKDFLTCNLKTAVMKYGVNERYHDNVNGEWVEWTDEKWKALGDDEKRKFLPTQRIVPSKGPSGSTKIVAVNEISETNVEFTVHVNHAEVGNSIDSEVRDLIGAMMKKRNK